MMGVRVVNLKKNAQRESYELSFILYNFTCIYINIIYNYILII